MIERPRLLSLSLSGTTTRLSSFVFEIEATRNKKVKKVKMEQSCLGNWIITGEGGFAVVGLGITRGSTGTARELYIYIY